MTQSTQESWRNQTESSSDQSSENERSPSSTRVLSINCKDAKLKAKNSLSSNSESIITMDMLSIYEKLTPTFDSSERRRLFLIRLQHIFDLEFPDQEIKSELFGSSTNSLGSNHSDVDVCILTPGEVFKNIRTLANCLKKYGFTNITCIPEAKIPIVKAYDTLLDLACDFNVNNPVALSNTKLIRTYVDIDPRVRPLTMMIKYWTSRRKLNDAAAGGTLSTYTWVNIVFNFLQMRNPPILPVLHQIPCAPNNIHGTNVAFFDDVSLLAGFGRANKETLGGLLFAFFKHFGYEFDFNENVVSVRNGKYLSKKEKGWHSGKLYRMFCIEEPFTTIRNLGNSADLISVIGIRDELRRAARILLEKASFSMVCQTYRPIYYNSDGSETEDPNNGETSFFQWDDEIVNELTYLTSQLALDHPHYLHPPKYDPKRRINLPKSSLLPNIPNLHTTIPEPVKPAVPLSAKPKDHSPKSSNRSKSDQRSNHDTSGYKPKGEPNGKENNRRSNSSSSRNRSRGRSEKSGNRGSKNSNSSSNSNTNNTNPTNNSTQSSKSSRSRKKPSNRNSSRTNGKANPTATATVS